MPGEAMTDEVRWARTMLAKHAFREDDDRLLELVIFARREGQRMEAAETKALADRVRKWFEPIQWNSLPDDRERPCAVANGITSTIGPDGGNDDL